MRKLHFLLLAFSLTAGACTTDSEDKGSIAVSLNATGLSSAVSSATLAVAGLTRAVSLQDGMGSSVVGPVAKGKKTVIVEAQNAAGEVVATASATAAVEADKVVALVLNLGKGSIKAIAASNNSPATSEIVTLTVTGTAASYHWSDNCGGAFLTNAGDTATWQTVTAGACSITAKPAGADDSEAVSLVITVRSAKGTSERIAGTGVCALPDVPCGDRTR